jgi:hypothetical protein
MSKKPLFFPCLIADYARMEYHDMKIHLTRHEEKGNISAEKVPSPSHSEAERRKRKRNVDRTEAIFGKVIPGRICTGTATSTRNTKEKSFYGQTESHPSHRSL